MNDYHTKTINIFCFIFSILLHSLVGFLYFSKTSHLSQEKISIQLKDQRMIRDLGKKDSKNTQAKYSPTEKNEADLFKEFAIAKDSRASENKKIDSKQNKQSKEGNKPIIDYAKSNKTSTERAISFTSRQAVAEVKQERSFDNPILNNLDYNLQFTPPKGIPQDELNDFEKVFYAFYKRVASQYINSIHSTYLSNLSDKPYLQNKLLKHKPVILSAYIQYDGEGNAEVIKILKSSEDDDVHQLFEAALKKMSKIPNIAKELKNEDGKYQAFFQLSLNNQRQ